MKLIITEKPSVAREYARALGCKEAHAGYIVGEEYVITWCIGHLVEMSYPDRYDEKYSKWNLDDLPFLPKEYMYEVKTEVEDQYMVVEALYRGETVRDIDEICLAGDSAREGIYIQELVRRMAKHDESIPVTVVWLDSFTESEIHRGIRERKPLACYQPLIDAAYARAIEDYAVGINFTRALSCKFGYYRDGKYHPIQVGRVMSCVLGMIVRREKEIEAFKEKVFYKIEADLNGGKAVWKAVEGSIFFDSPDIYNKEGFEDKTRAEAFAEELQRQNTLTVKDVDISRTKKNAPALFNLAELQSECSKEFKISPDETLAIAQKLYEMKLTTYPRTDARVLTSAVVGEIGEVIEGILNTVTINASRKGTKPDTTLEQHIKAVLASDYKRIITNKKYVDDSKVSDHYAIIPTGEGSLAGLSELEMKVYIKIVTRFLAIFYPAAEYEVTKIVFVHPDGESFFLSNKQLISEGYLAVYGKADEDTKETGVPSYNKGDVVNDVAFGLAEGKTTPPKHYTSGSMILAMENAGNLIEDEELRNQIKGSGIGTSATRAEVIKKLVQISYIDLNKMTQVLTPAKDGIIVYDIVESTIPNLLDPQMTASWERGLAKIEEQELAQDVCTRTIEEYVTRYIGAIKEMYNPRSDRNERRVLGKCPMCKDGDIVATKFGYGCTNYKDRGCRFVLGTICGKHISESDAVKILAGKKSSLIKGFTSKSGKTFDAYLMLGDDGKVSMEFAKPKKKKGA